MGNRCRKVLERYLEVRSETSSPVTLAHYRTHVTALLEFLRVHFPEVDSPEDLRRAPHIEAWLQSLAAAKPAYKNNTRNQIITHVRRFFADLRKWQWAESPPPGLITRDDIPPREQDAGPSRNWRVRPSQARFTSSLGESGDTPRVQEPLRRVLERYLEIRRSTMAPFTLLHHRRQILSLIRFLGTHFPLLDSLAKLRRTPHIEGWLEMLSKAEPPYSVCWLDRYIRRVQRFLEDIHEWNWPQKPPSGLIQPGDFPAPESYSERKRAGKRLQGQFPAPGNSFHQILKRYLDVRGATLRPGTVRGYRVNVLSFLRFLERNFTDLQSLEELRRVPHIEAWLKELATAKPPFQNGTRRKRIRSVARFLQDIRDWDWTDSPSGLFRWGDLPPAQTYLPRPLAPDVDERLLDGLRNDGGLVALGLIVARRTGLRIGELLRLELNCLIEDPSRRYSLRVPLGKLRNERVIPIDAETAELITTLRTRRGQRPPTLDPDTGRPVELLLPNPEGKPLYTRLFARKLNSVARSVGITDNVHPHRLRHTYATELLRNGVSLVGVMRLLGHRTIKMTLRYVDVTNEDLGRDYLQAMEKARHRYAGLKDAGRRDSVDQGDPLQGLHGIEAAFDTLVARVQVVRFDEPDAGRRRKIQRLVERLRRVQTELPRILS